MTEEGDRRPRFRQVTPGIMVSGDIEVRIDHPDTCFILRNEDETATLSHAGALSVFSSEDNARAYIESTGLTGAVLRQYPWDELVEEFGDRFAECLVDHSGEEGFYGTAPLAKGI